MFAQLVANLNLESKAEQCKFKNDNEHLSEKRLLYKRHKRFDENKKALKKADETNRKELGIYGP